MGSTRLPGKVLSLLGDHTALELLLLRLRRCRELDHVTIATSTDPVDDAIEAEARRLQVGVLRGPLEDVLTRFVQAARATRADAVVRITADCPLTDPDVVDEVVRCWRETRADYVTNILEPRSYPDGFDVEVITVETLNRLSQTVASSDDREHVTLFIRRHPEMFRIAELRLEPELGHIRATLDTPEDLETLRRVIASNGPRVSLRRVVRSLGHDDELIVTRVR
jgi:spore coat polysaccharide biosynthesis protein SpsF (cytidylyltransferase family)